MKIANKHPYEEQRIQALKKLKILDTPVDNDFDQITLLAAQICNVPTALISFVDESRQWFKSRPDWNVTETSRDIAFCSHTILTSEIFIVNDATKDVRFLDNPLVVKSPNVVFYAGVSICSTDGYPIGALCVVDSKPNSLNEIQKNSLKTLAHQISKILDLKYHISLRSENDVLIKKYESEIKKIENEKNEITMRLIDASKFSTLGKMAGCMAHELNTPLTILLYKSNLIKQNLADGKQQIDDLKKSLEKINITAEKMAKIISSFRLFSRNSENDPLELTSIQQVVESTLDLCREIRVQSDIVFKINLDSKLKVLARPTELSQVLMNLICNSSDAIISQKVKWIDIKSFELNKQIFIWITDSGNGIDSAVAEKMMNPFYTTKEAGKGTGLGLSISKSIIENSFGGKLYFDNECENTRFVIELPLAADSI